jgi:hypothetical protein
LEQHYMADEKNEEKLGKVVANLKVQLWADDVLVAESLDEYLWSRVLNDIGVHDTLENQRKQLDEVVKEIEEKTIELKKAKKAAKK